DEVDIDRGRAAVHLLDHQGRRKVSEQNVRRGSRERIRKRPRAVWLDARETLALRLEHLLDNFPDRQGNPAEIAVRADEEPVEHVTASQLTTRIVDGRGREAASWRVARQEIPDGDSTVGEEGGTDGQPAHALAHIGRTVRDEH